MSTRSRCGKGLSQILLLSWCFTATENIRLRKTYGLLGTGEGGEEGDYIPIATLSPPE